MGLNCRCLVAKSRPTLCDSMDCSLPASSVHGIPQASTLEWVAISFFKESSQAKNLNPCLLRLLHWQVDSLLMNRQGNPLELHKLSQIARKQSDKLRNILQKSDQTQGYHGQAKIKNYYRLCCYGDMMTKCKEAAWIKPSNSTKDIRENW